MKFCVVGSGIVGLSTVSELLAKFPNSNITLVSEKFGEETTSHGAAGIFRPGGGFHVSGDGTGEIGRKWITDSYEHYNNLLVSSEDPAKHGIRSVSGYIFSDEEIDNTGNKLLENLVPIYRRATEEELQICPGNWKHGSYFTTMVITSQIHLQWLTERTRDRIEVTKGRIDSFKDLHNYDYVFNCTGLGAKWLCHDDNIVPIRGQVFKVKAPWLKMFYYSNSDTYIIPGMHQVTLGGTRQFDNYSTALDPHDSAGIWERCTRLVPNLKGSQVIREWAGLRPYRNGGVRSELEIIKDGRHEIKVIHNYGHGGYGVTFAPGSTQHSVKTFIESHQGIWKLWRSKI